MGVKLNSSGGGSVEINPPSTGSTFTLTAPAITDTIVTKTSTDTLTNKTLTSPTLTSPTITGASMSSMSSSVLTSMTAVTPSGTSVTFTGIPSWAKRLTVMFSGVSSSGTSIWLVQLGTSSGFTTSGYSGVTWYSGSYYYAGTAGMAVTGSSVAASSYYGNMMLTLLDSTNNVWTEFGNVGDPAMTTQAFSVSSWGVTLASTLTQIRLTTVNGTDTFDAGKINVMYE